MKKVALGTVQFGIDYGINNSRGKIPENEVYQILDEAYNAGIDILDTAHAYGNSEELIGRFISRNNKYFRVVSKLPACKIDNIEDVITGSLNRLNLERLYGYIIHDFLFYKENPEIIDILKQFKDKNKIRKIGFSLYYPHELEYLLENEKEIDLIQVPYNIFDRRFEKYFKAVKERQIELHVRSVFLQGLFFKDINDLNPHFTGIKDKLIEIKKIAQDSNIPIEAVCLNFALLEDNIDKTIVGIDSVENLKNIINTVKYQNKTRDVLENLNELEEHDENILVPFKWVLE
ncbi:aldo/keto reductase [bacterium]